MPYSIAIAGAGPAGLSAALLLHRAGHRVTIFERFAQPQPIGSGLMLQPTGLAVLDELGLATRIMSLGHRIDRLFGRVTPTQRVILDVHYKHLQEGLFGVAVHRAALFGPLFEAVLKDKIALETNKIVSGIEDVSGKPSLTFDDGSRAGPFDLVIDALGMRSTLASHYDGGARNELTYGALWTTLPWPHGHFREHALEQRYEKASVMIGVLPIGRRIENEPEQTAFFWSIRPRDYETWLKGGLDAWKARVRKLWPETEPLLGLIHDPSQMTLARYSHHTVTNPVAGRLVAIGDSAHAASPQLGQGANMAMLDARALSVALRDSSDVDAALSRYAALRRWHVRLYQYLSAMFTPFYQSDSGVLPHLRDWLVAPATRLPLARTITASMVAGTIMDPRRKLDLKTDILVPPSQTGIGN